MLFNRLDTQPKIYSSRYMPALARYKILEYGTKPWQIREILVLTIFAGSMSASDVMGWPVPNDAGHSPAAAPGEKFGFCLCIGHSGGGLSAAALTGDIKEPDNPIFNHCN